MHSYLMQSDPFVLSHHQHQNILKKPPFLVETFWFFKKFWGTYVLFVYPCLGLLVMSPLGFKAREGSLMCGWQRGILDLEANVSLTHLARNWIPKLVIISCIRLSPNGGNLPWDSSLVRHLPTSWQPAWQPSWSRPHTCDQALVGLERETYCTTGKRSMPTGSFFRKKLALWHLIQRLSNSAIL